MFFKEAKENQKITSVEGIERETVTLCQEPCDCHERHGRTLHNNGGNYHGIERVHTYSDDEGNWCVVLERTTTREGFPMDEYDALLWDGEKFEMLARWKEILLEDEEDQIVDEFLYGEAQIIASSQ